MREVNSNGWLQQATEAQQPNRSSSPLDRIVGDAASLYSGPKWAPPEEPEPEAAGELPAAGNMQRRRRLNRPSRKSSSSVTAANGKLHQEPMNLSHQQQQQSGMLVHDKSELSSQLSKLVGAFEAQQLDRLLSLERHQRLNLNALALSSMPHQHHHRAQHQHTGLASSESSSSSQPAAFTTTNINQHHQHQPYQPQPHPAQAFRFQQVEQSMQPPADPLEFVRFASLHSLSAVAAALQQQQQQQHQQIANNQRPAANGQKAVQLVASHEQAAHLSSSRCKSSTSSSSSSSAFTTTASATTTATGTGTATTCNLARRRREPSARKCRKVYGIAQRQLWCTQCKWKKACSRFFERQRTSLPARACQLEL